jgi:glucose-6-phosphate 1-epimerase
MAKPCLNYKPPARGARETRAIISSNSGDFMIPSHELNARFSAEGVHFEDGPGGLVRARLEAPGGEAEIYLHGAHVAQFTPRGHAPLLFVSRESAFAPGQPIRGGVPVIFPWFGPREDGPLHGMARLLEWSVADVRRVDDALEMVLELAPETPPHPAWPNGAALQFFIGVSDELRLSLAVFNRGAAPFRFEEALHTYFTVGDAREVQIHGLQGARFLDKTDGFQEKTQGQNALELTGETDRVYFDTTETVVIHDPVLARRIRIEKENSGATVVWNPWENKARAMPDFGDDEWTRMLCIETCNVMAHAIEISPGESHVMTAKFAVESI